MTDFLDAAKAATTAKPDDLCLLCGKAFRRHGLMGFSCPPPGRGRFTPLNVKEFPQ
jgi:hypothetical protein